MAAQKRNSRDSGQGTISFARKQRRPAPRSAPPGVHKGKLDATGVSQTFSPRVQRNEHVGNKESSVGDTKSPNEREEILNGANSKALLKELRRDRFEYPRFHQDNLSVCQQLLRQFDMIPDYGPCQGLTRIQRWNRADKFGKKPPLQIKAVLDAATSLPDYTEEYEMSVFGKLH